MFPAIIENYDAPTSVHDALQALAKRGAESYFVAGGQSLMQAIKARIISPKSLIDLQHVTVGPNEIERRQSVQIDQHHG